MSSDTAAAFEFITLEPANHGVSPKTRTKIKKQAMRTVGLSRRKVPPQMLRRLQPNKGVPCLKTDAECSNSYLLYPKRTVLPRPVPLSGLAHIIATTGVHVFDLSALTVIHIGLAATQLLQPASGNMTQLLKCRHPSYFDHICSRYGHLQCLDDAILCILLKARTLLCPQNDVSQPFLLASYGRALRNLQSMVNDPIKYADSDVLCAADLLALFELLSFPSVDAWASHIAGAACLIQLRRPSSFTEEYDKSLFTAMVGPIVCEAFRTNSVCFLDNKDWYQVLRNSEIPHDVFGERSPLGIELALLMIRLPAVARNVTKIICIPDTKQSSFKEISTVTYAAQQLKHDIQNWRDQFDALLLSHSITATDSTRDICDHKFELLGTALALTSLTTRLLSSLSGKNRILLEDDCNSAVMTLRLLQDKAKETNFRSAFYLGQKYELIKSILQTSHLWRQGSENVSRTDTLIERWKFQKWCDLLPRSNGSASGNRAQ